MRVIGLTYWISSGFVSFLSTLQPTAPKSKTVINDSANIFHAFIAPPHPKLSFQRILFIFNSSTA